MENNNSWFGVLPQTWSTIKISSIFKQRNIKVNDSDYKPLSVTKNGIVPQLESAAKSDDHNNRKLVRKGDFVINSRSDRKGSCGISKFDGSVSLINTVLNPQINIDASYYDWVFHTAEFANEFYKWGHGIVDDLWTTRWEEMKSICIPQPPLHQQKRISSYIETVISKINNLIQIENRQIDKLLEYKTSLISETVTKGLNNTSFKNSGVKWIDKIPANWEIKRLKNIKNNCKYAIVDGPFGSAISTNDYVNSGIPLIRIVNLEQPGLTLEELKYITEEHAKKVERSSTKKNDIIFAKTGATIGKCAINNLFDKAILSSSCVKISLNSKSNPKYYFYYFNTPLFNTILRLSCNGTTRDTINLTPFSALQCCAPKIEEQIEIANYLDKKCATINSLILIKKDKIKKLENYKKSIIYECVFGMKKLGV